MNKAFCDNVKISMNIFQIASVQLFLLPKTTEKFHAYDTTLNH